ncbi:hypothetical protein BDW02DRAFT_576504 [Decorospora gaudefroyi]|uniref:Uncharacterized protein n=1 Tax=Decorospora gaudefroyi TaxID=184978 RepID=A0A6A5KRS6_9PLEO|nr:hypothetical protein BDW02DRAFT_576504 [Decorospora gaudefroyi]
MEKAGRKPLSGSKELSTTPQPTTQYSCSAIAIPNTTHLYWPIRLQISATEMTAVPVSPKETTILDPSPNLRYGNVIASERWSVQAHEQIMTTVTKTRNEMSTALPLLAYRDVRSKLAFLDKDTQPARLTHVAVLNHTLEKYPQGAFCLLLRRKAELDACQRLQVLPAILPQLGDFASRLQKTKLLICPGPSNGESDDRVDVVFSVDSDLFHVESWDAEGSDSHSILSAQSGRCSDFKMQLRNPENSQRSVQSMLVTIKDNAVICLQEVKVLTLLLRLSLTTTK